MLMQSSHVHSSSAPFPPRGLDSVRLNVCFCALFGVLADFLPALSGFLLLMATFVSSFKDGLPALDSRDEPPVPTVATVGLESPESVVSSRPLWEDLTLAMSNLDRLAATLAVCRVSGRVVCASSLYSSK